MLFFGRFVHKCITHAVVTTLTPVCKDELDTTLRRAACLDPDTFQSVLSRCANHAGLSALESYEGPQGRCQYVDVGNYTSSDCGK